MQFTLHTHDVGEARKGLVNVLNSETRDFKEGELQELLDRLVVAVEFRCLDDLRNYCLEIGIVDPELAEKPDPWVCSVNCMVYRFGYGRSNGVKQAAWEIFRKALCGEGDLKSGELIMFAKTYESMKSRLYQSLFDIIEDKSDDGYSDLLDNLPLVGQELFMALERKDYGSSHKIREEMHNAIDPLVKKAFPLGDFNRDKQEEMVLRVRATIWHGENYHSSSLRDAAQKYIACTAKD